MSKVRDTASEQPSAGEKGVLPIVVDQESVKLGRALARILYVIRFKTVRGVTETYITASSMERAQEVAKRWVNSQPGRSLLTVRPAVVADETILEEAAKPVVEPVELSAR